MAHICLPLAYVGTTILFPSRALLLPLLFVSCRRNRVAHICLPLAYVGTTICSPHAPLPLLFALIIKLRKRLLHLRRDFPRHFDIHQRPAVHPRTILCRLAPLARLIQQLRPIGKRTALQRLNLMYRAAIRQQKRTLFLPRLLEPQQSPRPAKIPPRELRPAQPDVPRQPRNVIAIDVNKALLLATSNASGLTLKAYLESSPGAPRQSQICAPDQLD